MPPTTIALSSDLKRLQDEGYDLEIRASHLLVKGVPYVNTSKDIRYGTLVSTLVLAGDVTTTPDTHAVMFIGEMPCDHEGEPLTYIRLSNKHRSLSQELTIDREFSSKPMPAGKYQDYYEKMTAYVKIISAPAKQLDPLATAQAFLVTEADESESVFRYHDTASTRAGIRSDTEKLGSGPVAILGVGGTGSYILDLVAKTPTPAIHLFDGDTLGQHNAFRAPGAVPIRTLRSGPAKAAYYKDLYSAMHRNIHAHGNLTESNAHLLSDMDFAFVAVGDGHARALAIRTLETHDISFIVVGMGVNQSQSGLSGQLTIATSTKHNRDDVRKSVSTISREEEDEYSRNIQIADLNSLNATLAVIKWKKLRGFYADFVDEHFATYALDGNKLINRPLKVEDDTNAYDST